MFKIQIHELVDPPVPDGATLVSGMLELKRYEQLVDVIDIERVQAAVNYRKRAPRTPKAKPAN